MSFRILVIDAHRNALEYYRQALQEKGYGVEITTFGIEQWEDIERSSPDLIIFDLLADADQEQQALDLARRLHHSAVTASIPLLICIAAFALTPFSLFV